MPRAPRRCNHHGCSRTQIGSYCDEHWPQWPNDNINGSTRSWRRLRSQVLVEEPWCRDCGTASQVAGHIVARALGGADVRENLKGQCERCNTEQIVYDRRIHMQGGYGDV